MTQSARFVAAITGVETAENVIWLLIVEHADLAAPVRLARNWRSIVSKGKHYQARPFHPEIVTYEEDRPPRFTIRIGNVDEGITEQLQQLTSPATVTLRTVLTHHPSIVEQEAKGFQMETGGWNRTQITAEMTLEDFLQKPCPDLRHSARNSPGVHRS